MNNSTNSELFNSTKDNSGLTDSLSDENVKINKIINKLPESCGKVSNETVQRIVDFARAYKVVTSKYTGHVEMILN